MIEVTCPSARFNTHQGWYKRNPKTDLLNLLIDDGTHRFERGLTVAEAEQLAKDLTEWVKEIKGEEETE